MGLGGPSNSTTRMTVSDGGAPGTVHFTFNLGLEFWFAGRKGRGSGLLCFTASGRIVSGVI